MKVKLLTLQCIKNYGSVLQTFATEQLLLKYYTEVETIQYIRHDAEDKVIWKQWTFSNSIPQRILKMNIVWPIYRKYIKVFREFLNKNINQTDQKYYTDQDFKKYPLDADAFCVGSDQVWNSTWNQGVLPAMFLEFAPENSVKFSFCSSFGKTALDEVESEKIEPYLKRLDHISVRESTALPVLESLSVDTGIHLLDPTLLVAPDFWEPLISSRLVRGDYVLVYQLNPNKEFDDYAYRFAKRKGIKVVFIGMRMKDLLKKGKVFLIPSVYDFLSLFKYASYVITDSFHGTAFSINFNKEFIDIYPEHFSTRLQSILEWANLTDRHLESFDQLDIADQPIDYTEINNRLLAEREKATAYLENVYKSHE